MAVDWAWRLAYAFPRPLVLIPVPPTPMRPQLPHGIPIPLPEPLDFAHTYFRHDRRRGVAVGERTGRLWLLEIDPGRRAVEVHPLPIMVPPRADGRGWMVEHMSGSHTLDRLLLWSDRPRVYALPSAEVLAEPGEPPGRATCLAPSGHRVISVDEDQGWTMDLDASALSWAATDAFHRNVRTDTDEGEDLFLDHVDGIVAHPCEDAATEDDDEEFWLAAGCYGFAVIHRVRMSWGNGVWCVEGKTRSYGGFVYDPTELLRPWGHRHVFLEHGFGTGLAALDPEKEETDHGWIRGPRKQPYSFIHGVVACGDEPLAWGHSKDGAFLWRVGEPPRMMPEPPGPVLALYPGALLCQSPGGDALLWCDLPRS